MTYVRRTGLGLALIALSATLGGCPIPTPPPAEAVLAGEWRLTTQEQTGITATFLQFNDRGRLTRFRYEFGATTIEGVVVTSTSTVVANGVNISVGLIGGGALVFEGTLSADENTIDGNVWYVLGVPVLGVTITVDNGPATLTRQ